MRRRRVLTPYGRGSVNAKHIADSCRAPPRPTRKLASLIKTRALETVRQQRQRQRQHTHSSLPLSLSCGTLTWHCVARKLFLVLALSRCYSAVTPTTAVAYFCTLSISCSAVVALVVVVLLVVARVASASCCGPLLVLAICRSQKYALLFFVLCAHIFAGSELSSVDVSVNVGVDCAAWLNSFRLFSQILLYTRRACGRAQRQRQRRRRRRRQRSDALRVCAVAPKFLHSARA